MGMVSDVLTALRETFTDPSHFHLLEPECLSDFQYNVFSTLYILSCYGLLDHVFDLDLTGVWSHQSLLVLRLVLGQYYPSVLPMDDEQTVPGLNDQPLPPSQAPALCRLEYPINLALLPWQDLPLPLLLRRPAGSGALMLSGLPLSLRDPR